MEIPIEMDDLGGKPTIFGNTNIGKIHHFSIGKTPTPMVDSLVFLGGNMVTCTSTICFPKANS